MFACLPLKENNFLHLSLDDEDDDEDEDEDEDEEEDDDDDGDDWNPMTLILPFISLY